MNAIIFFGHRTLFVDMNGNTRISGSPTNRLSSDETKQHGPNVELGNPGGYSLNLWTVLTVVLVH